MPDEQQRMTIPVIETDAMQDGQQDDATGHAAAEPQAGAPRLPAVRQGGDEGAAGEHADDELVEASGQRSISITRTGTGSPAARFQAIQRQPMLDTTAPASHGQRRRSSIGARNGSSR